MNLAMNLSRLSTCMLALLLSQAGGAGPLGHHARQSAAAEQEEKAPVSDTAQDYSHTIPLSVSGKQGVVGFRLPQSVYLHAHSADLNDVRIFDASGAKLPFALQVPPLQGHTERQSLPVKIFPVSSNQPLSASAGAIDLDIRTGADGSLLSVKTKAGNGDKTSGQSTHLVGLVLDARQFDSAGKPIDKTLIDALHFSLPAQMKSYTAQVWLEVSDDLKQWDTIGAAELSWLVNTDTQTLANDRLEFEPRSFRYARLTWRSGEPIQFGAITVESVVQTQDAPTIEKLVLQPSPGKEAQDLVYKAAIAIPVEKIGLQFTEENVVLPATLGSYRELPSRQIGQPTTWRFEPWTRATFYQITQEGKVRRSGDISISLTHADEWVLRPQVATGSKPTLSIAWQPAALIFLASGKGPYTLAFGRDKVKPAALDLSQVAPGFTVPELAKLEQAVAGPVQTQQVLASLQDSDAPAASAAARMKTWVLWVVLLLGVAVLGALAWSLLKEMKHKP
jgi:hypothetical protein